jgi:hypothetical protein
VILILALPSVNNIFAQSGSTWCSAPFTPLGVGTPSANESEGGHGITSNQSWPKVGGSALFPQDLLHLHETAPGCFAGGPGIRFSIGPLLEDAWGHEPFGQLSITQAPILVSGIETGSGAGKNSLLAEVGDVILRASCHANDLKIVTQNPTGAIRFGTTPSTSDCSSLSEKERMCITNAGNIGIGTPYPYAADLLNIHEALPTSGSPQVPFPSIKLSMSSVNPPSNTNPNEQYYQCVRLSLSPEDGAFGINRGDGILAVTAGDLYFSTLKAPSDGRATLNSHTAGGAIRFITDAVTHTSSSQGGGHATEKVTIANNGNVGIGNTSPSQLLEVKSGNLLLSNSGTADQLQFQGTGTGITTFQAGGQGTTTINYTLPIVAPPVDNCVLTSTTSGVMSWSAKPAVLYDISPSTPQNTSTTRSNNLFNVAYSGSDADAAGAVITSSAGSSGNHTATGLTIISTRTGTGLGIGLQIFPTTPSGNINISTLTHTENFLALAADGLILCKELVVKTTSPPWPDYVFNPDYKLMPLADLEKAVKENKHLPDLPSAKEIETGGVNVAEIEAKLVKKVEELTLYIVEQEKRIKALEQENNHLQKK